MVKNEGLTNTIKEVIVGSLYKALLYNRSPNFTLVEESSKKSGFHKLKLKSKLLNNFVTLSKFMCDKKEEKILNLIYEKSSNDHEKKELVEYLSFFGYSRSVGSFIYELNKKKEEVKGLEKFCDDVISQFDGIDRNIKLIKSLPNFKEVLAQVFEKFKDQKRVVKDLFVGNLYLYGCCPLYEGMKIVYENKNFLLSNTMSNLCGHWNDKHIKEIEEIKNVEGIFKQINDYANQKLNEEVQGIEKLIVAMMLLGYEDMHGSNIGIMEVKYKDKNDQEVIENVYAKIDMSASFYNLKYTHCLDYINIFKYLLYPNMQYLNIEIEYDINYSKLKEEINKACDLFTNCEYVESLIYKALFYKKPLLKTKEELSLVEDLAKQIVAQAKLLKEFGNSQEFKTLKEYVISGYNDYIVWALDNNKRIENKHPIVYAIENKLHIKKFLKKAPAPDKRSDTSWFINPVYWTKYNDAQDLEFLDWMKANENSVHIEGLKQLEEFIPRALIHGSKKSVIEKITDMIEANLAQSLEGSKNYTTKEVSISCIKDNIQKAR